MLLLSTPGFRDGRGIGRLIEMEVSNAIRSLPMERSSDEFKAEILMPGTQLAEESPHSGQRAQSVQQQKTIKVKALFLGF